MDTETDPMLGDEETQAVYVAKVVQEMEKQSDADRAGRLSSIQGEDPATVFDGATGFGGSIQATG